MGQPLPVWGRVGVEPTFPRAPSHGRLRVHDKNRDGFSRGVVLVDAVEYFEFVRDSPFRMALSAGDPSRNCLTKSVILKALLSSLGLKARYALCRFSWNDLDLPKSLKEIPHRDVVHVFLEVYSEEQARWMTVDATWDKGLSSKLRVSHWDGRNDTTIGVPPTERLSPIEGEKELDAFFDTPGIRKWLDLPMDSSSKVNGRFYEALNEWTESLRP